MNCRSLVYLMLVAFAGAMPLHAQQTLDQRVALVVGVSSYGHLTPLPNAANDARSMATALAGAGFKLVGDGALINPDRRALQAAITTFVGRTDSHTIGLFYFAGHGMQIRERNFLAPVDASLESAADADRALVAATELFRQLKLKGGGRVNIIILDACRNNPLQSSAGVDQRGLGTMDAPTATLISYATQPGNVALDGQDGHSPYTSALVEALRQPGLTVLELFNETGLLVQKRTGGVQIPWVSLSPVPSRVYLTAASTAAPAAVPRCPLGTAEIMRPVDNLFRAWTALDFPLYAAQWRDDAFQVAGKIQRDRTKILAQRRDLFARLQSVTVRHTAPVIERGDGKTAFVRNRYTMEFTLKTGRRIVETDVQESYMLACGTDGTWRIKENFDYLAG